ncbi:MAG: hypothetical protein HQL24_06510 [Candidatus Omnitrophica bacterium]|nr:hypothetical protein [Candidatus Omnitrophota bacterium]
MTISQAVLDRFKKLIEKNKLAHAYLFIGAASAGKTETALAVAKLVNCLQKNSAATGTFCGECESCRKVDLKQHPDVHLIEKDVENEAESISIEQIRGILSQIQLRPFEGQKKVFIIKNIEDITLPGANALLKTLEEPSDNSLLILTTSAVEKNLDTIVSRCHAVYFPSLSQQGLKKYLMGQGQTGLEAHFLAYFAQGCLGKIEELERNKIFERKNVMINSFVYAQGDEKFLEGVLEDKTQTKEFLDILLSWIRDALLLKSAMNDEEQLIHLDRSADLKIFSNRYSFEELNDINRQIIEATKLLTENLNVKISLLLLKERLWEKSYKSN